jgi:hypothetical protein
VDAPPSLNRPVALGWNRTGWPRIRAGRRHGFSPAHRYQEPVSRRRGSEAEPDPRRTAAFPENNASRSSTRFRTGRRASASSGGARATAVARRSAYESPDGVNSSWWSGAGCRRLPADASSWGSNGLGPSPWRLDPVAAAGSASRGRRRPSARTRAVRAPPRRPAGRPRRPRSHLVRGHVSRDDDPSAAG